VLLPQYNNGPGAAVSTQALNTVQAAFGANYTVYPINADQIITAAGAFHCIVQHVPVEKGAAGANGGLNPTAYLRGPNNGETFQPGQHTTCNGLPMTMPPSLRPARADGGCAALDRRAAARSISPSHPASLRSGRSTGRSPTAFNTTRRALRVLAHDADGNLGFDDSDRISPSSPRCPTACGPATAMAALVRCEQLVEQHAAVDCR
jgi:hypothetical protein